MHLYFYLLADTASVVLTRLRNHLVPTLRMGMIVTFCFEHPIGISLLQHASQNGCTDSFYFFQCLQNAFVPDGIDLDQSLRSASLQLHSIPFEGLKSIFRNKLPNDEAKNIEPRDFQSTRSISSTSNLDLEEETADENLIPSCEIFRYKQYFLFDQWNQMQLSLWEPSKGKWVRKNLLTGSRVSPCSLCLPAPLEVSIWSLLWPSKKEREFHTRDDNNAMVVIG